MKRLALIGLLGAVGLAVTGCGAGGSAKHSLAVPVSPQVWHRIELAGVGARFISPTRLAFLTSGSGSCPPVPYRLTVRSPHSVRVDLTIVTPKGGACTADLRIAPVAIAVDPSRIDVHRPLKVSLYYPLAKRPVVFTAPAL